MKYTDHIAYRLHEVRERKLDLEELREVSSGVERERLSKEILALQNEIFILIDEMILLSNRRVNEDTEPLHHSSYNSKE